MLSVVERAQVRATWGGRLPYAFSIDAPEIRDLSVEKTAKKGFEWSARAPCLVAGRLGKAAIWDLRGDSLSMLDGASFR